MKGYAVGLLNEVNVGTDIVEYLQKIDATLKSFDGRFLIHGGRAIQLESSFTQDLIVIEFPSVEDAQAWYGSDAYQEILPLRTKNARSTVFLIHGVPTDHRAPDVLQPRDEVTHDSATHP